MAVSRNLGGSIKGYIDIGIDIDVDRGFYKSGSLG